MVSIRRAWLPLGLLAAVALALAALALARPADAAVTSLSIVPTDSPVEPGGSVTVALVAEATDPGIDSWTIDVVYDNTLLTASACTSHASGTCNQLFAADTVRFAGASVTGLTGTTELGTITFDAATTEGIADVIIDLTTLAITENLEPSTPGAVNDGTVTIQAATPTPTASPATATPTTAATATATPTPPAQLPTTGGSPGGGEPGVTALALIAAAVAVSTGAAFAYSRRRVS